MQFDFADESQRAAGIVNVHLRVSARAEAGVRVNSI
jgi:hypothetical protein